METSAERRSSYAAERGAQCATRPVRPSRLRPGDGAGPAGPGGGRHPAPRRGRRRRPRPARRRLRHPRLPGPARHGGGLGPAGQRLYADLRPRPAPAPDRSPSRAAPGRAAPAGCCRPARRTRPPTRRSCGPRSARRPGIDRGRGQLPLTTRRGRVSTRPRAWARPRRLPRPPIMGGWERPGTSGAVKRAAEAVVETVDGGLAELMPDRDRRARLDAADRRGAAVARRPRRPGVPLLRVPAQARARHRPRRAARQARARRAPRRRRLHPRPLRRRDPPPLHPAGRRARRGARPTGPPGAAVGPERPDPGARPSTPAKGSPKVPDGWADLVIADVFSGARTPAHLTATEFLDEVRRVAQAGRRATPPTSPTGRRSPICAARSPPRPPASPNSRCIADPTVLRGKRFGNAVLVASDAPAADRRTDPPRRLRPAPRPASNTAGRSSTSPAGRRR